jgi:hypothetical protein
VIGGRYGILDKVIILGFPALVTTLGQKPKSTKPLHIISRSVKTANFDNDEKGVDITGLRELEDS